MLSTELFMVVTMVLVVGVLAAPDKSYIRMPRKIYTDAEVEVIFARSQYCGRDLDEKLQALCGLEYNKRRPVREATDELDVNTPSGGAIRYRRGITEECCHRGCADSELQQYCLHDATTTTPLPEVEPEAAAE